MKAMAKQSAQPAQPALDTNLWCTPRCFGYDFDEIGLVGQTAAAVLDEDDPYTLACSAIWGDGCRRIK